MSNPKAKSTAAALQEDPHRKTAAELGGRHALDQAILAASVERRSW